MRETNAFGRVAEVLILLAAAVFFVFLILDLPIYGPDSYFHLSNLQQYITLRSEGIAIPRWLPNNFYQFGSTTYYYYPPFVSILGSFVALAVAASAQYILNLSTCVAALLAIVTMRAYLLKIGASPRNSWLGALLYATGPYAYFDVWFRSAYGEYYALIWIPLVLLSVEYAVERTAREAWLRSLVLAATGTAGLLLTSMPAAAMMSLTVPIYVFTRCTGHDLKRLLPVALGAILGVLIANYNLIPAIGFEHAAYLERAFGISVTRFTTSWISHMIAGVGISFDRFECVFFPITLVLLIVFARYYGSNVQSRAMLGIMVLIVVLHIPFVTAPFATSQLLEIIQYPTRMYLLLCIPLAVLVGLRSGLRTTQSISLLIIVVSMASLCIAVYEFETLHGLPEHVVESSIGWSVEEYVPKQAPDDMTRLLPFLKAHADDPEVTTLTPLPNGDRIDGIARYSTSTKFHARVSQPTEVRFHRFFWPLWLLSSESKKVLTLRPDSNGLLIAKLPPGDGHYYLQLSKSSWESRGEQVSQVSVLTLAALLLLGTWRSIKKRSPAQGWRSS